MKILSIIAQKPSETGSGIYLQELIKSFSNLGHKNALVCASYENDIFNIEKNVKQYKLIFDTADFPYKIYGMSDEMPYESYKYSDMDDTHFKIWSEKFLEIINKAVDEFEPDIIICHHLYLLTSLVRDKYKDKKVIAFCHTTDLRQYIKNDFKKNYIKEQISKLDKIAVLTDYYKDLVVDMFGIDKNRVYAVGAGYNKELFNTINRIETKDNVVRLLYVGKVSIEKGVLSLIKAIKIIEDKYLDLISNKKIVLNIIGSNGNRLEYEEIVDEAKKTKIEINFLGKLPQIEISKYYKSSDILTHLSFNEGLALTAIEAFACGMRIVISNFPGIKNFIKDKIDNANVRFVDLPMFTDFRKISKEELIDYENRAAKAIIDSINDKQKGYANMTKISWDKIAKELISEEI